MAVYSLIKKWYTISVPHTHMKTFLTQEVRREAGLAVLMTAFSVAWAVAGFPALYASVM